jgi:hypothetical protein
MAGPDDPAADASAYVADIVVSANVALASAVHAAGPGTGARPRWAVTGTRLWEIDNAIVATTPAPSHLAAIVTCLRDIMPTRASRIE